MGVAAGVSAAVVNSAWQNYIMAGQNYILACNLPAVAQPDAVERPEVTESTPEEVYDFFDDAPPSTPPLHAAGERPPKPWELVELLQLAQDATEDDYWIGGEWFMKDIIEDLNLARKETSTTMKP